MVLMLIYSRILNQHADDISLFAITSTELYATLDLLLQYCYKWKLKVNTENTKIVAFRKGGRLAGSINFSYYKKIVE